jgi:hypothetical protein
MNAKYILSRLRKEGGAERDSTTGTALPTVTSAGREVVGSDPVSVSGEGIGADIPEAAIGTAESGAGPRVREGEGLMRRPVVIERRDGAPLCIFLLEDAVGVTASGTGATLWDSAIVLTKYLLADRRVHNKRILELGAGLGLPSIALAICGNTVVASERGITYDLLQTNIAANANSIAQSQGGSICSRRLEWSTDADSVLQQISGESYDIIIASDLIFPKNEDAWRALAVTFKCLLLVESTELADAQKCGKGAPKTGYLAYENRRDFVIKSFIEILREEGLNCNACDFSTMSASEHFSETLSADDWPSDILLFEITAITI